MVSFPHLEQGTPGSRMHSLSASAQVLVTDQHKWPFTDQHKYPRPVAPTETERTRRCGPAGLLMNYHMPHLSGNFFWSQRGNPCRGFSTQSVSDSAPPPTFFHLMCPPTQTHTCYFYLGEAESTRQGEKSGEKKESFPVVGKLRKFRLQMFPQFNCSQFLL